MGIIQLKEANCKNCYKCIRNCELKAIQFRDGQARIMEDECVLCGKCTLVCPQNAKHIFSDIDNVKQMLAKKAKVYVSLAPSYIAAFPGVSFVQMSQALKKLGFIGVEETAIGATEVSKEFAKFLSQKQMKNVITTCCPTVNMLVEKYYPTLVPYLAPVAAPATAHAKMLRNIYGNRIKTVFIGPCISKKYEAQQGSVIHAVLLFEELRRWMEEEGVTFDAPDAEPAEMHTALTRLYPVPGGILRTVPRTAYTGYKTLAVDGLNRCISILNSLRDENIEGYFLEMSACSGSCMEGPGMQEKRVPFLLAKDRLVALASRRTTTPKPLTEHTHPDITMNYSHTRVRSKLPTEQELEKIYHEIGKFSQESMLNCGACGYNTCREKAIAVYQGKADLHMCLPYLREKAESLSNLILDNTPNAIFVVNKQFEVLDYNKAAQRVFGLSAGKTVGSPIQYVMDAPEFERLKESGEKITEYTHYRDEAHGMSFELTIVSAEHSSDYIIIARDVSSEEQNREEIEKIRRETIATTQRVIDKQMRAAQEIASLLGETTGETKAALSKLKKSIMSGETPL